MPRQNNELDVMFKRHPALSQVLQDNHRVLKQGIHPIVKIVDQLFQENVIDREEKNHITGHDGMRDQQAERLLDIISYKETGAWSLAEALLNADTKGQQDLGKMLRQELDNVLAKSPTFSCKESPAREGRAPDASAQTVEVRKRGDQSEVSSLSHSLLQPSALDPQYCDFVCSMNMDEPFYNVARFAFENAIELLVRPLERVHDIRHKGVTFRYQMSEIALHRLSTITSYQPGLLAGIGILKFKIMREPEVSICMTDEEPPWTDIQRCDAEQIARELQAQSILERADTEQALNKDHRLHDIARETEPGTKPATPQSPSTLTEYAQDIEVECTPIPDTAKKNPVSVLHERCQKALIPSPTFILRRNDDSKEPFTAEVRILLEKFQCSVASASTKKMAKTLAAAALLEKLLWLGEGLDLDNCSKP